MPNNENEIISQLLIERDNAIARKRELQTQLNFIITSLKNMLEVLGAS